MDGWSDRWMDGVRDRWINRALGQPPNEPEQAGPGGSVPADGALWRGRSRWSRRGARWCFSYASVEPGGLASLIRRRWDDLPLIGRWSEWASEWMRE